MILTVMKLKHFCLSAPAKSTNKLFLIWRMIDYDYPIQTNDCPLYLSFLWLMMFIVSFFDRNRPQRLIVVQIRLNLNGFMLFQSMDSMVQLSIIVNFREIHRYNGFHGKFIASWRSRKESMLIIPSMHFSLYSFTFSFKKLLLRVHIT